VHGELADGVAAVSDGYYMLTLPGMLPLSMNERERAHYRTRMKELDDIELEFARQATGLRIPPADGKRAVRVTIHKSKRSRRTDDPANRDSRAKSILDALVRTGLLVDDDDRHLDWLHVHEGERLDTKVTIVELWDVEWSVA
jgi:hypothetical protein